MRKLLFLILLGAGLWSGYWFVGSNAIQRGADDFFADAAARGLVAENSATTVSGYPNRFDLTISDLNLADLDAAIGWKAPFVQVFAMTWKPWHIIAALPPEQQIFVPDEVITLASEGLRASLRAKPASDLPLAALILEGDVIKVTSSKGWTAATGRSVASFSADEEVPNAGDAPNTYVLSLSLVQLAPDPVSIRKIVDEAGLPPTVAKVELLAKATLTAPLDRFSADTRPRLAELDLSRSEVIWGDLGVAASGKIAPDDQGYAAGRIEIAVTNYQRLVPALVAAGVIKPEISLTVGNMLTALAQDSGEANLLKLRLLLEGGRMSLGPLPLGDAPLLVGPTG